MTINNELLAKFEGKCWHKTTNEYHFRCAICGQSETDWQGWFICPHNPDYSTSPADRERLLEYLMGKVEMWNSFHEWAYERPDVIKWNFIRWLFLPLDGVPRWVSLLSEWLGMESVRERFGMIKCPNCVAGVEESNVTIIKECTVCNGTGKIRAEWAKEE